MDVTETPAADDAASDPAGFDPAYLASRLPWLGDDDALAPF